MPNIGLLLKQEISRLARRAAKPAYAEIKKDMAELKRRFAKQRKTVETLQRSNDRLVADLNSRIGKLTVPQGAAFAKIRLGPKLIQAQRKRLGLSRREFGKLLGVSANTLYLWENGKTAPRAKIKAAFAAVRQLGRRQAKQKLEALVPAKK